MGTILQVVGAIALLVVLTLVGGFFWIRRKIRRAIASLGGMTGAFEPRITLTPDTGPPSDAIEPRAANFEAAGFRRAGAYCVREMDGLRLVGLVDEQSSRIAVAYESKDLGAWSDVFVRYEAAGALTVSSSALAARLDDRPGHTKIFDASLDERGLLARMDEEAAPRARRPVKVEEFAAVFEKAYADEMDWRLERGGATLEEAKRIAESMDGTFTQEEIERAREALQAQASEAMTEICRQAFASTMDGAAWERIRERVAIVHEKMTPQQVWEAMEECLCELDDDVLGESDYDTISTEVESLLESRRSPLSLADAINGLIPEGGRFKVGDTLSEPVSAVLYVAP